MHQHFGSGLESPGKAHDVTATPLSPIQRGLIVLRRQYAIIIASTLLALGLGATYLWLTRPVYTAVATMMLDARHGGIQQKSVLGDTDLTDSGWIDSQLGVLMLQRYKIAADVARTLGTNVDPNLLYRGNFISELESRVQRFFGRSGASNVSPKVEVVTDDDVATAIGDGLDVRRVGLSYLVNVNFSSHSEALTARIANAAANAYVFAELRAKEQDIGEASNWLQKRYESLQEQASAADRAVVDFEDKNDIIVTDQKLFNEQELARINGALSEARAKAAGLQAKVDQIHEILKEQERDGGVDATVSDALQSEIVNRYRAQYLDVVNRAAHLSKLLGPNHLAVVNLRTDAKELRGLIHEEIARIGAGYESDLEIAKREEAELTKQQDLIITKTPNEAQIKLRSLAARAESYRTFYDQFFLRYTEAMQQESLPIPSTRVVSYAPGAFKSDPAAPRILMLFLLGGGIVGFGAGFLREVLDHVFRTRIEVEISPASRMLGDDSSCTPERRQPHWESCTPASPRA